MNIVYMGTPWFANSTLESLVNGGYEVSAVYTQPDRESGRGRTVSSSAVKKFAIELGLAVEQPENFSRKDTLEKLKGYHPQAIVVFSYGQILPQTVLDIAPLGCINVHPSLLPEYRHSGRRYFHGRHGDENGEETGFGGYPDAGSNTGDCLRYSRNAHSETCPDSCANGTGGIARAGKWCDHTPAPG